MLGSCFVLALASISLAAPDVALQKRVPVLVEVTKGPVLDYRYDAALGADAAKRLVDSWRRSKAALSSEDAGDTCPATVVAVPGREDLVLVAEVGTGSLARCGPSSCTKLDGASGGDSYIWNPLFFVGAGRVFVFAELGTEYSWGYQVYEIVGDRLLSLGTLDVTIDNGFNAAAPTDDLSARLADGQLVPELSRSVFVGRPDGEYDEVPLPPRGPIRFRSDGKTFVLMGAPGRDTAPAKAGEPPRR